MPVWLARANGEHFNLSDIYPRGCTVNFLDGAVTEITDFELGDDEVFDFTVSCPSCAGPLSDDRCITCGQTPEYWSLQCDEELGEDDTTQLWPLPELPRTQTWDDHGLDCSCPDCSSSVLLNDERHTTPQLIQTESGCPPPV